MRMHNVTATTNDAGDIILTQRDRNRDNKVYLHPEQLRLIACRAAGLNESTTEQIDDLKRKIGVLTTGLEAFVYESSIRDEILYQCDSGLEFIARLDALLNLAWEYDGGRITRADMKPNAIESTNDDSATNQNISNAPIKTNATKSDSVTSGELFCGESA